MSVREPLFVLSGMLLRLFALVFSQKSVTASDTPFCLFVHLRSLALTCTLSVIQPSISVTLCVCILLASELLLGYCTRRMRGLLTEHDGKCKVGAGEQAVAAGDRPKGCLEDPGEVPAGRDSH